MIETERPFRPYAPPANMVAVFQRLRRMNTPPRITREFLRGADVTENLIPRVIAALRFLDLVNEQHEPTDTLKAMATSTDEEYRKLLEAVIRKAYADDFQNVDPAVDPQNRILDTFQKYQPSSQHQRQVMLFSGLCREAGIAVLDAPRERGMQERRIKSKTAPKGATKPGGKAANNGRVRAKQPDEEQQSPASTVLFGVTRADFELLEPAEFKKVWDALGTVMGSLNEARRSGRQAHSAGGAPEEDEDTADS